MANVPTLVITGASLSHRADPQFGLRITQDTVLLRFLHLELEPLLYVLRVITHYKSLVDLVLLKFCKVLSPHNLRFIGKATFYVFNLLQKLQTLPWVKFSAPPNQEVIAHQTFNADVSLSEGQVSSEYSLALGVRV